MFNAYSFSKVLALERSDSASFYIFKKRHKKTPYISARGIKKTPTKSKGCILKG